jgi:hypothetical protein
MSRASFSFSCFMWPPFSELRIVWFGGATAAVSNSRAVSSGESQQRPKAAARQQQGSSKAAARQQQGSSSKAAAAKE